MEMYGRKITPNLREGTPNHLYLPGSTCGRVERRGAGRSKEIILCEALIDALTFWNAGFRNVTASYGVNGFTADHRAAFEKHGTSACTSPTTATRPERKPPPRWPRS
jgi:DNA primase